jgi:hypothetical protein
MAQDKPEIMLDIPLEEMVEWMQHPTTKKVHKFFQESHKSLEMELCQGQTLSLTSLEAVGLQTNYLLGEIKGASLILQMFQEVEEYQLTLTQDEAQDGN